MFQIVLTVHVILAVSLILLVLIQRSEGGGLGLGSSSGSMGSFMSVRGTANLLTRTTALLAASFFATSVALGILGNMQHNGGGSVLDKVQTEIAPPVSGATATQSPATELPATQAGGQLTEAQ